MWERMEEKRCKGEGGKKDREVIVSYIVQSYSIQQAYFEVATPYNNGSNVVMHTILNEWLGYNSSILS